MCVLSLFGHVQPFVTLCSQLDSSVHGILQARILDWVSMLPSKGSSQPRGQTHFSYVSCIGSWDLTRSATWEAQTLKWSASKKLKKEREGDPWSSSSSSLPSCLPAIITVQWTSLEVSCPENLGDVVGTSCQPHSTVWGGEWPRVNLRETGKGLVHTLGK